MQNKEYDFFASANSGRGFINYFDFVTDDLGHLYIIKGGSGTGKSYFMKQIANKALTKGYTVEYYRCSSDPDSLDGLVIKELNIGFIDGTAPHTKDPKYPGAYDEIINVGDFWDKEKLIPRYDDIKFIIRQKTDMYKTTYRYLSSALTCDKIIYDFMQSAILYDKMYAQINRMLDKFKLSKQGKQKHIFTDAISMKGFASLDPYKNDAKEIITISNRNNVGFVYINIIAEILQKRNTEMTVSHTFLDENKINMLYIPEIKTKICISDEKAGTKHINVKRFIDKEKEASRKNLLRYTYKIKDEMLNCARLNMEEIKKLHFALEDIYIDAMDFRRKAKYEKKIINQIFS